jgi:hypothetical protein
LKFSLLLLHALQLVDAFSGHFSRCGLIGSALHVPLPVTLLYLSVCRVSAPRQIQEEAFDAHRAR